MLNAGGMLARQAGRTPNSAAARSGALFSRSAIVAAEGAVARRANDGCTVDVTAQFRYNGVRIEQLDDAFAASGASGREKSGVLG